MSQTLPLRPSIDHTPRSSLVIDFASREATTVFNALASGTARDVVETLADGPATASDIADAVDTSLQNVQYHLSALRKADLVVEAGTWYSSRGKEMTVYAVGAERVEFRVASPGDDSRPVDADTDRSSDPDRGPLLSNDVPSAD